jgi:hypothetical protein
MKQQKFDSEEALEIIAAMDAAQQEAQKKNMGARLKELAYELEQLKRDHPDEYWEAAVTMDPMPTLIPRRPLPQLEWRDEYESKGIFLKGKRGSLFDPTLPLNKDIIEAWEGVKGLQYQMKDSDLPWAVELRNLPRLGEKTVPQWKKWIKAVWLSNHNQHPEKTAHAATNVRHRNTIKNISDPDKRDAAVFDRLWNEMVVVKKGALTMLAKDLDRVRGL